MLLKNYISILTFTCAILFINNRCCTMEDSYIGPAPHAEQSQNDSIDYYKQENDMLKAKLQLLSRDFDQIKHNYNTLISPDNTEEKQLARNTARAKLKKLLCTQVNRYNPLFRSNWTNILDWYYAYVEGRNTNSCLPKKTITEVTSDFERKLRDQNNEFKNMKEYLNKFVETLLDFDLDQIRIKQEIVNLIKNDLDPIIDQLSHTGKISENMNIKDNLSRIREYKNQIKAEENEIRNKLKATKDSNNMLMQKLSEDIKSISNKYNNIIKGNQFFQTLMNEARQEEQQKKQKNKIKI